MPAAAPALRSSPLCVEGQRTIWSSVAGVSLSRARCASMRRSTAGGRSRGAADARARTPVGRPVAPCVATLREASQQRVHRGAQSRKSTTRCAEISVNWTLVLQTLVVGLLGGLGRPCRPSKRGCDRVRFWGDAGSIGGRTDGRRTDHGGHGAARPVSGSRPAVGRDPRIAALGAPIRARRPAADDSSSGYGATARRNRSIVSRASSARSRTSSAAGSGRASEPA